jgi:hypothetical protein
MTTSTANLTVTVKINRSQLFTRYNHLRAIARKNPTQVSEHRLNKALGIAQSKAYYVGERAEYHPTGCECGCKDFFYQNAGHRNTRRDTAGMQVEHYDGACKHNLAEVMIAEEPLPVF